MYVKCEVLAAAAALAHGREVCACRARVAIIENLDADTTAIQFGDLRVCWTTSTSALFGVFAYDSGHNSGLLGCCENLDRFVSNLVLDLPNRRGWFGR